MILWGGVAYLIRAAEQEALAAAYQTSANLALAVGQHAKMLLDEADRMALEVRNLVDDPAGLQSRRAAFQKTVQEREWLLQAAVSDASGAVVWTTVDGPVANIRDREHFQAHVERDLDRPFVSKPVLGRVSRNWSVQLTRRITAPNGGFAGVVVISLDPFYFTRRFSLYEIGLLGHIALAGTDGVIRARTTESQQESAGAVLPDAAEIRSIYEKSPGLRSTVSVIDSVERLDVVRAIEGYELVAIAGVARVEALAGFVASRRNYIVFGVLVSTLLLGMALLAVRGLRRESELLERAEAARVRAQRSNLRKTEFIGAIAHEVRTPLSSIIGYAQLIASGKTEVGRHAAFARQVEAAGLRVSETMNDLLEIARIEAGSLVLTPARVSLREVLGDCAEAFEAKASAAGLVLRPVIAADVPEVVEVDRSRIQQVLSHLVDNAIRNAGKGEVQICVTRDRNTFRIEVVDPGEGVPRETLESLFNRFDEGVSPVALRISGTGLGLSIVKAVAERMGGRVYAEVGQPTGTRISVTVPLVVPG